MFCNNTYIEDHRHSMTSAVDQSVHQRAGYLKVKLCTVLKVPVNVIMVLYRPHAR